VLVDGGAADHVVSQLKAELKLVVGQFSTLTA
jgi:hypothetical protein